MARGPRIRQAAGPRARSKPVSRRSNSVRPRNVLALWRSSCFEGFKAFPPRRRNPYTFFSHGSAHFSVWRQSARAIGGCPNRMQAQLAGMVARPVNRSLPATRVPEAPGALYLRPILFGTNGEHRCGGDSRQRSLVDRAREAPCGIIFSGGHEGRCAFWSTTKIRGRQRRWAWSRPAETTPPPPGVRR